MHHALHIEEILLHIFSYCHTIVCRWPPRPTRLQCCYANANLASLARTCKTFKGLALDMIWAELDDLSPLIRCLPKESWIVNESGVHSLYPSKTCLDPAEWDIVLGYARRVRALPRLRGSLGLAPDCIEALSELPASMESMFPNLRVVGLQEPNTLIAPFIQHLINPKVTDISFERTEILAASLSAFGKGCSFVTDFRVSQWAHNDSISDLICYWHNLRSLRCYNVGLNANALSHLSHSRNLHYMSFQAHDTVVDELLAAHSSTATLSFSKLHDLHLYSPLLSSIWSLLHHLRVPVIRDLSVCLQAHPTALDLISFFEALQEACIYASLNTLLLSVYPTKNGSTALSAESIPSYYITFDRLRPLTVFSNIQSITLDIPFGLDLNEHELLSLASSWPRLESFVVGKDYDWTPSSAITPSGFVQLLEKCKSLRVLYFPFNTQGFTEIPRGHPWRGRLAPKNTFIHLLNSPIEETSVHALAVFFHVAPHPDFRLTTHWNNRFFRGSQRPQELCAVYHERWMRVRELAHDLWKERRELKHAIETRTSHCGSK